MELFRLIHSLAREEPDKSVEIRNCRRNAKATPQAWAGDGDVSDEVVVWVYVLESVWASQSASVRGSPRFGKPDPAP